MVLANVALAASLFELDLSSNGIGLEDDDDLVLAHGASACDDFAQALHEANRACAENGLGSLGLRWLNFSQNFIADRGMLSLAHALEAAPQLTWLDVSCCNINDAGLRCLARHSVSL